MNNRYLLVSTSVACLAAFMGVAEAGSSSTSLKAEYVGAEAVFAQNGETVAFAGVQPPSGAVRFSVPRATRKVTVDVEDRSGRPIAVHVVVFRGNLAVGDKVACAAGVVTAVVAPRATSIQVIPLAGACGSGALAEVSVPTAGVVSARFTH